MTRLVVTLTPEPEGVRVGWEVDGVRGSYLARPVEGEPRAASPPVELRREGGGFAGKVENFLRLPAGLGEGLSWELRWDGSGVSSLREGVGRERLDDTYVMCGDLKSHRDGDFSVWWLTDPGIDVRGFCARLGPVYRAMAETFGAAATPFSVFFRTHPHRGINASAHPASFVMAVNPVQPLDEASIAETVAHELVHEWLRLDGPDEDTRWFLEGAADYYSFVVPYRAGLIDDQGFLQAVNLEAREAYASPYRDRPLREAGVGDFLAHRLPYVRGMFYLADLDARLRRVGRGLDEVVRSSVEKRITVEQWCATVEQLLDEPEAPVLEKMVFAGDGRPGADCFAGFEQVVVPVPVLDLGFDSTTLVSRRVTGLVPGGPADRAGLREGEAVDLPRYPEIVRLNVGDELTFGRTSIPLTVAAPVPQWRQAGSAHLPAVEQSPTLS